MLRSVPLFSSSLDDSVNSYVNLVKFGLVACACVRCPLDRMQIKDVAIAQTVMVYSSSDDRHPFLVAGTCRRRRRNEPTASAQRG